MGPWEIAATTVQTTTLPFSFAPVEIGETHHQLLPDFGSIEFINKVGSYALTVFSMLDFWGVLGIFVVLLLAIRAVWWLYSFVTDQPANDSVDISGALNVYTQGLYQQAEMMDRSVERIADELRNDPRYGPDVARGYQREGKYQSWSLRTRGSNIRKATRAAKRWL